MSRRAASGEPFGLYEFVGCRYNLLAALETMCLQRWRRSPSTSFRLLFRGSAGQEAVGGDEETAASASSRAPGHGVTFGKADLKVEQRNIGKDPQSDREQKWPIVE